ncbi:MAG: glycosyltransferase family 4 protein [bacterium]|nr:glycosyltransferase family 4 protein [bacterium]
MRIYMIGQKGIPARGGGVERHVEELATRLVKNGHEVFVYCRAHYTSQTLSSYRGIHLIHLPTIRSKYLDAIVHTFLASVHVLFQPADIIHYHSIGPALLLWIPRFFRRNVKIFFTFHSQCYHHEKWGFIARLYLRLGEAIGCRAAHTVITVSKTLTKYTWTAYQRNAVYIPNGAPRVGKILYRRQLQRLDLTANGYILAVARLIPHKGIHELISAYQRILTKKKLVIVGDGTYTDRYVQKLYTLAKGNPNILFLGNQIGETLATLYGNAYCFVHPSHSEGLSIALLEAMQYGQGVLTSSIPENREVIEGVGYTFRTGSVDDLTHKLDFLLRHPDCVRRAGQRARLRARHTYHWETIVRTTERCYREATNAAPRTSVLLPEYEQA